jgi:dTDP-4-amino-4,6-dideoxygalactose transaminase
LEEAVRSYVGCAHTIAVTSCTTGLEVALRALGVGPGDEVIVPDYTYPATAYAVNLVGARCLIVDVDKKTMNIDYAALERAVTPATKAVIPVSLFGSPLDYDRLGSLKRSHGFYVVEDAACSLGATYKGARVGALADISVFSFHPRKFITTGEGGAVCTNNDEWAEWINSFKHFGMDAADSRGGVQFQMVGTNYKLSDVLAAIGLSQMESIDELLTRRQELAGHYLALLADTAAVTIPEVPAGGIHSYQSFCVFVNERDRVMADLRSKGIEAQIGTYSLHMHAAFSDITKFEFCGAMGGSRFSFENCLALPLYHEMTRDDQVYVVSALLGSAQTG